MPSGSHRLPNLQSLGYFEAAGRHLSFTRAAAELNVTQGAVSRQIRQLEDWLGRPLFRRLHRALEMTPEGHRYHQAVSMALGHIAASTAEIATDGAHSQVTVAASLAVSTFWLMPRVDALRAQLRDLEVHVLATDVDLDTIRGQFDLGITYGAGNWPGFRSTPLARGEVFPVCSPAYLDRRGRPESARALLGAALLVLDQDRWDWVGWPTWFASQGIAGPFPKPFMKVSTYPLLIQAALSGQGVALGWHHLVDEQVASGALVKLMDDVVVTEREFHLVVPADLRDPERIAPLERWIVGAFRRAESRHRRS